MNNNRFRYPGIRPFHTDESDRFFGRDNDIERLWRLSDAVILSFDGDAAVQKAGLRAALRALPQLAPAKSLAFATLPKGQRASDRPERPVFWFAGTL